MSYTVRPPERMFRNCAVACRVGGLEHRKNIFYPLLLFQNCCPTSTTVLQHWAILPMLLSSDRVWMATRWCTSYYHQWCQLLGQQKLSASPRNFNAIKAACIKSIIIILMINPIIMFGYLPSHDSATQPVTGSSTHNLMLACTATILSIPVRLNSKAENINHGPAAHIRPLITSTRTVPCEKAWQKCLSVVAIDAALMPEV